jgi:hypothetical protein
MPAAFAFAFVGSGLQSVIRAGEAAYAGCLAAGGIDCRFELHAADVVTPQLVAALVALGLLALIPVMVKRLLAWRKY